MTGRIVRVFTMSILLLLALGATTTDSPTLSASPSPEGRSIVPIATPHYVGPLDEQFVIRLDPG